VACFIEKCIVRGVYLCYNVPGAAKYIPMNKLEFRIIIGFIIFILFFLENAVKADNIPSQAKTDNPEGLKSAIIVKFPAFIKWPSHSSISDPHSPFVIGVVGDTPIFSHLGRYAKHNKIRGKKVNVIAISGYSRIKTCNILFIAACSIKKLREILQEIEGIPILTISDTRNYEKRGVMINLFILGEFARFNVNCGAAKKSGLIMTSKMVRYAKTIIK
jgi:hypothetical protein